MEKKCEMRKKKNINKHFDCERAERSEASD